MKLYITHNNGGHYSGVALVECPAGANEAGTAWKDAFMESGASGATSIASRIGEKAIERIESGAIIECPFTVAGTNDSNPINEESKLAIKTQVDGYLSALKRKYNYYGMTSEI